MTTILICEDEQANSDRWVRGISAAVPITFPAPRPLVDHPGAFKELFARLRALREGRNREEEHCGFDGNDVLVVDYDLVMFGDDNARHTGEELARLCRILADVGYVVVMNQYNRSAHFDLRLSGHPNSYADVNVAAIAVDKPGLWRSVTVGDFKPWYWDSISDLIKSRRTLSLKLEDKGLDSSVIEFIGMPDEVLNALPDEVYEHLNRDGKTSDDLVATTFHQFLGQQIESKDIARLIMTKPGRAAALAVARTAKWLSRMVLGPQDLLVDIPHLLERLPFLMDPEFGDPADPAVWQRVPLAGLEAIVEPLRNECAFLESELWLGKACLWWPKLDRHESIRELRSKATVRSVPNIAFAEDRSIFVPIPEAEEFRSDYQGRYGRRWVKPFDGLEYEPRRRLLEI